MLDTERAPASSPATSGTTRAPERPAPPSTRPTLIRWIELLGVVAVAALVAFGLWFVLSPEDTGDGSFEFAEQARFERLARRPAIDVDEFALLESMVIVPRGVPTLQALQADADLYTGTYFGYLPDTHWLQQEADIYTGTYFGYLPENHWQMEALQTEADLFTGTHFGYLPDTHWLQQEADIYAGTYFGYLPDTHWLQQEADIYTGTWFGWLPMDYWTSAGS